MSPSQDLAASLFETIKSKLIPRGNLDPGLAQAAWVHRAAYFVYQIRFWVELCSVSMLFISYRSSVLDRYVRSVLALVDGCKYGSKNTRSMLVYKT